MGSTSKFFCELKKCEEKTPRDHALCCCPIWNILIHVCQYSVGQIPVTAGSLRSAPAPVEHSEVRSHGWTAPTCRVLLSTTRHFIVAHRLVRHWSVVDRADPIWKVGFEAIRDMDRIDWFSIFFYHFRHFSSLFYLRLFFNMSRVDVFGNTLEKIGAQLRALSLRSADHEVVYQSKRDFKRKTHLIWFFKFFTLQTQNCKNFPFD